ncbi:flagellar motor switch protein FliN [bacterium]|nr:flagellar motor switch protein FliN [bacterium]MBU1637499.1 flagellar motor switch protein FliN [bacterium]
MSELFRNPVLDSRIIAADESLRSILEQSLKSFLDRDVAVKSSKPHAFDYKEVKAVYPGELIVCTLTCTFGGQGRVRIASTKDSAAVIGDLLNMGDGKAEFAQELHLEPMRDLYKEAISAFSSQIGQEIGTSFGFDDVKNVIMDLTPNDFAGGTWTFSEYEFDVDGKHKFAVIISNEFWDSIYPRTAAGVIQESESEAADDPRVDYSTSLREEIGLVMDIELPIAIELGRTNMLIRDIVKLSPGSVVELNKLSGEPVDLYVNHKRFARGEVVVIDENFAVRLTELSTPEERLAVSRN